MIKEQVYDWNKLKKEFQDRLKKATPDEFTSIEFKNMWELAEEILYYADETISIETEKSARSNIHYNTGDYWNDS